MIMLTGDQETAARAVCKRLGIDTFRAQVLPADKASLIEGYKEGGSRLIMVGDGVNDSPALAAADVSVAMRDASDLAREVADITLLSSDLRELAALRRLSQRMLERINRNYWGFSAYCRRPPRPCCTMPLPWPSAPPACGPICPRPAGAGPRERSLAMKQHRFWAWGAVFCMLMCIYTGKRRK